MRILVTGGRGQLGRDVEQVGADNGDEITALGHAELDISQPDDVKAAVSYLRPELIINCAAWTAVDACEDDEARAMAINGDAVGYLGGAAASTGAHLVQVSTDYVFDGTKLGPYVEGDPTNPQSVYGTSKLAGEQRALAAGGTVVRTSWVCSAHGGNMVATILRLAGEHPKLRFVSDQIGHPTFTSDLAPTLRTLGQERHNGIVHVTNAGPVSWFEFAQDVLRAVGEDPDRVEPVTTAELQPPRPAARPANSVLSNDHLASLGHPALRDFRQPLAEVVGAYTD